VRWLCLAWTFASLADWFVLWVVVWSAELQGWSGLQTAGIIMAARAPALVGGIVGGLAIDRFGPRRMMLVDGVCRVVTMAGLMLLALVGGFGYAGAVALVCLAGATAPISYSAVRTFLPRLVGADDLGRANTLLTIGNALPLVLSAGVVGPALHLLGLGLSFLVPAALMVGVVAITLWLPTTPPIAPLAADAGGSVLDVNLAPVGGRELRRWRLRNAWPRVPAGALALLGLSTVYFFTFGPVEPVLPLVVRDHLDAGVSTYSLLWSVVGIGALLGLALAPPLCRLPRPGAVNALLAALNGVAMVPLAVTDSVAVAGLACLVIGVLWTPYSAVEATALQRLTPARHHGKLFGIQRALVISALPVGAAVGAFALDRTSATVVLLGSAIACIAFALLALAVPALRARVS
jgi:MFS family permease